MLKNLTTRALLVMATVAVVTSCTNSPKSAIMEVDQMLTQSDKDAGILTPEVMWKMGRVGASAISPDGESVVYAVTRYNMAENKGISSLYLVAVQNGEPMMITDNAFNDSDPRWSADNKTIYFLSDRSGVTQLWKMDVQTNQAVQVSDIADGIEAYGMSPSGDKMFYIKGVQVEKRKSSDIYPDLDKSKALIYDDLMARHWTYWDEGKYLHIFIGDLRDGKITEGVDILEGEPWDAPLAPYFDASEITWNNGGTALAYTGKKLTGTQYAVSTDSDIYLYDVESKTTRNLTEGMPGYDKYPRFSPNDSKIAFTSMERAGNESDKDRLMVVDIESGDKSYLTENFDYNASNITWSGNDKLYFIAPITATHQVCSVAIDNGEVAIITSGDQDINAFSLSGDMMVGEVTKLSMATELFNISLVDGSLSQLTNTNREIYDNVTMGEVQKRWVKTTDNKQMLTWVVLPPNFDSTKRYPALLYCQGGPQSVVSQFWSYRWNPQLMAARGYIVVMPNRRGLPSFGQEWLDQISGDYSGQNIRDYLSAIDAVSAEPYVDKERLGCVGASYGGYSVFFLAGNHDKRFKAFISHCGIFNFESMYGSTEELWFVNNDYGGSYWDNNPVAKRSYANSPHKFVQKWDTPIMIITGLNDFRIPYTQSLEAFTAARVLGVESRLVAFENEAHQVFKPQNSLTWNREFFAWLDKYLKQ